MMNLSYDIDSKYGSFWYSMLIISSMLPYSVSNDELFILS